MPRKVTTICDMCDASKQGEMNEVIIYNHYEDAKWNCPIPEVYLCDNCLADIMKRCGIDMDEVERKHLMNIPKDVAYLEKIKEATD